MDWLFKLKLTQGWLPKTMLIITVVGLLIVIILKSRKGWLKPLISQLIIGVLGFFGGWLVVWLLSDVFRVFGVSLGWAVMLTIGIGVGVIVALIAAFCQSEGFRRVLSAIMVVISLLTCALKVDGIYGEYTTLGSLFGISQFSPLNSDTVTTKPAMSIKQWHELAKHRQLPNMPEKGEVHSVSIPNTHSNFRARKANVYLPPAALSAEPPALPVMVVMAGQPGNTDRFFTAGQLGKMLNTYASKHDGLAPIAVSPDQNGTLLNNSLCSDTRQGGNAETYITEDVTEWIKDTLPVATKPQDWLIGGFSQGATCSTQLGPAHPDIYGHIFSAGGEIEPVSGSHKSTLKRYFNSDEKAYRKHVPTYIIANSGSDKQSWFSIAGKWDKRSQKNQMTIVKAAMEAGMSTTTVVTKESGHDWHTVQAGMLPMIDFFGEESGLGSTGKTISEYPNLDVIDSRTTARRD